MSILDDIKDSVDGSGGGSGRDDSGLDTSLEDTASGRGDNDAGQGSNIKSPGTESRGNTATTGRSDRSGRGADGLDSTRTQPSSRGGSTPTGSRSSGSGRQQSPNPQTGRPQQGSAKPRVSESTRREMQNAGLTGGDSSDGMEEKLKDIEKQNDQMIQILQRIERNLR